ncbi:MAG: YkgJ family cysteine cluster protein [Deltaproteobacteria bacterium]|nr:YkgJ family cysteine cluster protein [Deltaproteobacteria bacterium]
MTRSEPYGVSDLPEPVRDRRVGPGDEFCFACHAGLECFTRCCGDVNILLTPLDVLRLARRLGLETGDFLARHTLSPITKELHLPVVLLRMQEGPGKRCPFVGETGCGVYEDRPWSCRMYPLGMGLPPARAGVEPEPVFFKCHDDFCAGAAQGQKWTVESWRASQGVPEREAAESGFREIVAHPWFIGGRQLDAKRIELFHLACYDLDRFRCFVFESSFLERFELEPDLVAALRASDEELLRFAFRWLRFALFAEPTVSVREAAKKGMES